jgi:hypothetical protein
MIVKTNEICAYYYYIGYQKVGAAYMLVCMKVRLIDNSPRKQTFIPLWHVEMIEYPNYHILSLMPLLEFMYEQFNGGGFLTDN